ncbi:GNAT family N-acetyltransferase [Kibdelosporangium aridum]|uniref:GNAT family N-acetyltransferase n=1 Tax=Kibdelosporangium aridum TaxID=2030 RepID=A0A428ZE99_KIBAR|nr:GNAT family N-acetyltransferase [Kibdelosporangium aridum]RSM86389.1 GNAT family N-acetyltransferase [Kibdelosporangium aridum]
MPSLANGLLLRAARPQDRDAVAALLTDAHAHPDGTPGAAVGRWQRDYFDRGHPTVGFSEMMVVEEEATGALVSCLLMVPQTWCYAGIPFGVSTVELAATSPRYRRRGLMTRQLEVLQQGSARRGDLVQALSDILFFGDGSDYRPVLTQRAGRGGYTSELPQAADEPVRLRRAVVGDIPFLIEVDSHLRERVLVSCLRDAAQWRHELTGRSPDSMVCDDIMVVEARSGPVGYVVLGYGGIPSYPIPSWLPGFPCPEPVVSVAEFELLPGTPWPEVAPSVLRQLTSTGRSDPTGYLLWLGVTHPAYDVLADLLTRRPQQIGWFLRVPDTGAFLSRIAPALERRLTGTAAQAYTGDLLLHLYYYGLCLSFESGRLAGVRPWAGHSRRGADASLPEQMLLQLVFGHAGWDELAVAFPDCRMQTRTGRLLIPRLFAQQPSHIWPLI